MDLGDPVNGKEAMDAVKTWMKKGLMHELSDFDECFLCLPKRLQSGGRRQHVLPKGRIRCHCRPERAGKTTTVK